MWIYGLGVWCALHTSFLAAQELISVPAGLLINSGLEAGFVARFAFFCAVLLTWTILCGNILKTVCKLPIIAGQIIGGILLGPSLLNIAGWPIFTNYIVQLTDHASGTLYNFASSDLFIFVILMISSTVTVGYLLWMAGHETNLQELAQVGVVAVIAGILGAVLPIIITGFVGITLLSQEFSLIQAVSVGIVLAATSVSIPVAMLFAQGKMHLKSSQATLGAAIVDDIVAVVLLALFFVSVQAGMFGKALHMSGMHGSSVFGSLTWMAVAFVGLAVIGRFIMVPLVTKVQQSTFKYLVPIIAHANMFFSFAFAEMAGGLAGITGAYFAGLFHRMGDKRHQASKVIVPFVNSLLLPLFLGSIGLQIDVTILSLSQWWYVCVLLIVAVISKIVGCYCATVLSNATHSHQQWSWLEGYLFGAAMIARGEVGLIVATILNSAHIITYEQYIITVIVIVLTTIAAPIMLGLGFAVYDTAAEQSQLSVTIPLGSFKTIGTQQMLNIIVGWMNRLGITSTTVNTADGGQMVVSESRHIEIVEHPARGITVTGKPAVVNRLLSGVRAAVEEELEELPASEE